jgi:phage gp29-like protein
LSFTAQQQAVEDLADSALRHAQSPIDPAKIRSAILASTGPEDLEERLALVLRSADMGTFRRLLEQALFAADVLGYVHAAGK